MRALILSLTSTGLLSAGLLWTGEAQAQDVTTPAIKTTGTVQFTLPSAEQPAPTRLASQRDWRYRWHNGRWWYWMPGRYWMVYNNGWSRYSPGYSYGPSYSYRPSYGYGYSSGYPYSYGYPYGYGWRGSYYGGYYPNRYYSGYRGYYPGSTPYRNYGYGARYGAGYRGNSGYGYGPRVGAGVGVGVRRR